MLFCCWCLRFIYFLITPITPIFLSTTYCTNYCFIRRELVDLLTVAAGGEGLYNVTPDCLHWMLHGSQLFDLLTVAAVTKICIWQHLANNNIGLSVFVLSFTGGVGLCIAPYCLHWMLHGDQLLDLLTVAAVTKICIWQHLANNKICLSVFIYNKNSSLLSPLSTVWKSLKF